MCTQLITLLAETFIHPGSTQNQDAIDLPVARERSSGFPFIAGSSMKGAWLDFIEQSESEHWHQDAIDQVFGKQEGAGQLLFFDARLILLPVRSLADSYKWVTCPLVLERLTRDLTRAGVRLAAALPDKMPSVAAGCYWGEPVTGELNKLYLEERGFKCNPESGFDDWVLVLKSLIDCKAANERVSKQLAILSDEDFAWFATNALPIQARNVLDEKKQSQNLWYEEALPPDTLMYSLISQRGSQPQQAMENFIATLENRPYLQVGANETVGQGWFHVGIMESTEHAQSDNG